MAHISVVKETLSHRSSEISEYARKKTKETESDALRIKWQFTIAKVAWVLVKETHEGNVAYANFNTAGSANIKTEWSPFMDAAEHIPLEWDILGRFIREAFTAAMH